MAGGWKHHPSCEVLCWEVLLLGTRVATQVFWMQALPDPCIPSPSACELSDPRAGKGGKKLGSAELAPGPAGSGGWRLSRWMETMESQV